MSGKKRKVQNVRRGYRQLFISGFEHLAQSRDENGNSKTEIVVGGSKPVKRGERSYKVSFTLILEQVSNDSGEYVYRVLVNDDPDISVTPYSIRSKKETGQTAHLPKTGIKGGSSFSLVYGIHESGNCSLSHTAQHSLPKVAPQLYSIAMGAIHRAIECTILLPENEKENDDTGERSEGSPTQKSLGTDKEKRRSKKVRAEVLPEAIPEKTPVLVETDRAILGERPGNREVGPINLGSGADNGGEIADALSDGQSPDLGF